MKKLKGEIQKVRVDIDEIKPNPKNPKKHWDEGIEKSIDSKGYIEPIVINAKNFILAGHGRWKALKKLGYKKIDVIKKTGLTEKQELEYMIASNKIGEVGGWDVELLKDFEKDLLSECGFSDEELDKLTDTEEDDFDAEAEYEKIVEPKTKLGDLYKLGEHRLLCGDSEKPESFEKLMGEAKAQLVFTDPPFNVNYDYWGFRKNDNFRKKQKGKKSGKQIFNDKKKPADYQQFIQNFFQNCYNFSKDNSAFYCYYGSKNESIVRAGIENAKWYISQTLIWLKPNLVISPGQDYHRIYEPCYFGWKKGKKHFVNKKYGFKLTELILLDFETFEEYLNVLYEKRDTATVNYIHPTQKPVRLAERALKRHSGINDIILEPFNGSGSTMIACEQLQRKCYAIELDPKFVDVAIRRWETYTNKKAEKIA